MAGTIIGVDVGGTFTDLVALVDGEIVTAKVPTTGLQSEGVIHALRAANIDTSLVERFGHGTTVATNALLERKGARTALVTTEGFRDVIEIGRQNRPSLYDLTKTRPDPLVPRELRFTVTERMGPDGVITPIDDSSLNKTVDDVAAADVEAVAVCLLFGYLHPEHEQRIGDELKKRLGNPRILLSSVVAPEFREYERFSTTVAAAYLAPKLSGYLRDLADRVEAEGLPEPLVMQSSGGSMSASRAAGNAAACVLSGPAAGVVGASFVADACGYDDALTFDMGGTSTDVCAVIGGEARTTTEAEIAGLPIRLPMVDVHTVGAGGGSVAWMDDGGALRVGPQSAGADPGPASYGRGGAEATVTDANLLLGYLEDGAVLGSEVTLDRAVAEKAISGLAERLDLDPVEVAIGIVRIANAEMAKALRVISVERGVDPRDFALVAFGGAGPMHACALAEELGMTTVLVPRASGVLSALGLAISDLRRDYVAPCLWDGPDIDRVETALKTLESGAKGEKRWLADLRYRGQSYELSVAADNPDEVVQRFHEAHRTRFGYDMRNETIQCVSVRVVASEAATKPTLRWGQKDPSARPRARQAHFDEWTEIDVWPRVGLDGSSTIDGPAIVELAEATCVVAPGWRGRLDHTGTLILERS